MELWNVKSLQPPPIMSSEIAAKEISLKVLANALNDGISFFQNQQHLHTEAAVLSRLIYRMKMKFRSSKDFKILERLNHSLLNYLQIDMPRVLTTLYLSVPQQYIPGETRLPSRNMLDYVLVRLQGLGKLLWRILETCKIAAQMHRQRMRLGHFWKLAMIIFGIVSRIFIITKNMIKFTCELYSNLEPFLKKLSNPGVSWLPNNYVLPRSLSEWLDIDWLDLDATVIEILEDEPNIVSYFNLVDSDDDDDEDIKFCDEYILVNDEGGNATNSDDDDDDVICQGEVVEDVMLNTLQGFGDDVDVGEVVEINNDESPEPHVMRQRRKFLNRTNFFNDRSRKNTDSVIFVSETVADDGIIVKDNSETVAKNLATPKQKMKKKKMTLDNLATIKTPASAKKKKKIVGSGMVTNQVGNVLNTAIIGKATKKPNKMKPKKVIKKRIVKNLKKKMKQKKKGKTQNF